MDLSSAIALQPAYAEVGATEAAITGTAALPPGYHHHRLTRTVGRGAAALDAAGECIATWRMHNGAGIRTTADHPRATVGSTVVCSAGAGPFRVTAPCRVVWTLDDPTRRGFGYATLPGHPEIGEESFLATLDGDDVRMTICTFSRPARWYNRVASPVLFAVQHLIAHRYIHAVRKAVRQS